MSTWMRFLSASDSYAGRGDVFASGSFRASRAISTWRAVVLMLMICDFSARSAWIDAEQFEDSGLQRWRSWDLGWLGCAGGYQP